jgi:hypothetical protein
LQNQYTQLSIKSSLFFNLHIFSFWVYSIAHLNNLYEQTPT